MRRLGKQRAGVLSGLARALHGPELTPPLAVAAFLLYIILEDFGLPALLCIEFLTYFGGFFGPIWVHKGPYGSVWARPGPV